MKKLPGTCEELNEIQGKCGRAQSKPGERMRPAESSEVCLFKPCRRS